MQMAKLKQDSHASPMRYLPIFVGLDAQAIMIVGAGELALAKARMAARTNAQLTIFVPPTAPADVRCHHALRTLAAQHRIKLVWQLPALRDYQGVRLVYAATGLSDLDQMIARNAHSHGVLVNIVDCADQSDFLTPAIVERAPLVIAIGSEGQAPVLARRIKADLETALPTNIGLLATVAGRMRDRVARLLPRGDQRRKFWQALFFSPNLFQQIMPRSKIAMERWMLRKLQDAAWVGPTGLEPDARILYLITNLPDEPEDGTVRARTLVGKADTVLHDLGPAHPWLALARKEAGFLNAAQLDQIDRHSTVTVWLMQGDATSHASLAAIPKDITTIVLRQADTPKILDMNSHDGMNHHKARAA